MVAAGAPQEVPQLAAAPGARVSQQGLPSAFGWLFSQHGLTLSVGSQQGDALAPAPLEASAVAGPHEPGAQPDPVPQLESVAQLAPVLHAPVPQEEAARARAGTSTTVNDSA